MGYECPGCALFSLVAPVTERECYARGRPNGTPNLIL